MPVPSEPRLVATRSPSPRIRLPTPPLGDLPNSPGIPALLRRSGSLHLQLNSHGFPLTSTNRVSRLSSYHEILEASGSPLARALGMDPQRELTYDTNTRPMSENNQMSMLAASLHNIVLENEYTVDSRGRSRQRQNDVLFRHPHSTLPPSSRQQSRNQTPPTNVRVPTPTPPRAHSVKRLEEIEYLIAYGLSNNFYNNVVSWTRFSDRMAVGVDKDVYWWDGQGNVERIDYEGEGRSPITCVSCSDLHYVAISTLDGMLYIYDESSGSVLFHEFPAAIKCIKWMHLRNMFVAGDTKGTVYFGGIGQNNIYIVSEISISSQQICGMSPQLSSCVLFSSHANLRNIIECQQQGNDSGEQR